MSLIQDVKNNNIQNIKNHILEFPHDDTILDAVVASVKNCRFECFDILNNHIQKINYFNKKQHALRILEISARENKFDIFKKFFFQYRDFLEDADYKSFIFSSLRHHRVFKTIVENRILNNRLFYDLLISLHTGEDNTLRDRKAVLNKNIKLITKSFSYSDEDYFMILKNQYSFFKFFQEINQNIFYKNKKIFISFILEKENVFFLKNIDSFKEYLSEEDLKHLSKHLIKEKMEIF
tara:strand:+ start:113 stop:820 length:708 start_codon:yes stop_codon:yes gene_type:complete